MDQATAATVATAVTAAMVTVAARAPVVLATRTALTPSAPLRTAPMALRQATAPARRHPSMATATLQPHQDQAGPLRQWAATGPFPSQARQRAFLTQLQRQLPPRRRRLIL